MFDIDAEFPFQQVRPQEAFNRQRINEALAAICDRKMQKRELHYCTPRDFRCVEEKQREWTKCHSHDMRAAALFDDYRNRHPIQIPEVGDEYCAIGFAEFLLAKRYIWTDSTWRHVRIAATYWLEKLPDPDREIATNLINQSGQSVLRTSDPSALSYLPYEQYEATLSRLKMVDRGTGIYSALADWISASISTALAAAEWPLTEFFENKAANTSHLYVFDTRAPYFGETGSYRVLELSQLGRIDIQDSQDV